MLGCELLIGLMREWVEKEHVYSVVLVGLEVRIPYKIRYLIVVNGELSPSSTLT